MLESTSITLTLERGLQLLRAFRASRSPLTCAELARRTGLSRPSVSRLTATLVKLGYLRRVPWGGGLELAMASFKPGHSYVTDNAITELAGPILQHLADELDVAVALSIPDQLDMVYVACRTGPSISTLRPYVGTLVPMALTSAGRSWLWGSNISEKERYLSSIMDQAGAHADTLLQRINGSFVELDTYGVCTVTSEFQTGGCGIALPVELGRNQTRMAMSCSLILSAKDLRINHFRECVTPSLKKASMDLSRHLQDVDLKI